MNMTKSRFAGLSVSLYLLRELLPTEEVDSGSRPVRDPSSMHAVLHIAGLSMPWRTMSCHATRRDAMPCNVVPCRAVPPMPCHAVLCCAMPCHAVPCHAVPCHAVPWGAPTNVNASYLHSHYHHATPLPGSRDAVASGARAARRTPHLAREHVALVLQAVDERLRVRVARPHAELVLQQQVMLELLVLLTQLLDGRPAAARARAGGVGSGMRKRAAALLRVRGPAAAGMGTRAISRAVAAPNEHRRWREGVQRCVHPRLCCRMRPPSSLASVPPPFSTPPLPQRPRLT
eukprot:362716-Chlamydomonas_euryale.AAC.6